MPNKSFYMLTRVVWLRCVIFIIGIHHSNGFSDYIDYSEYSNTVCGAVLFATDPGVSNFFDSPNFPEFYPDDVDCSWEVVAPPGSRISLTSEYFDIEHQPECLWDYLAIEDGIHGGSTPHIFCGHRAITFVSESNIITVRFHSDASGSESGFRISYATVPGTSMRSGTSCNITLHYEGEITSPGYPRKYTPNAECHYTLEAPANNRIRLDFVAFHVESYPCSFDKLVIYDKDFSDTPIRVLCGREIPPALTSTANVMSLKFISDGDLEFVGFKANVHFVPNTASEETSYTSLPPSTTTTSTTTAAEPLTTTTTTTTTEMTSTSTTVTTTTNNIPGCNVTITSTNGRITSPGFPDEYPMETVCVTRLRSEAASSFLVRFINFTLEQSENCTYDSVSIYPVAPSNSTPTINAKSTAIVLERVQPPLRVMCGSVLNERPVISWEGRGLDIEFRSDRSVSGTGFVAETLIAPLDKGPQCHDVCQNGGSCLKVLLADGAIDWKCSCAEGYTGNMCQAKLPKTCDNIVCHNHGHCIENAGNVRCECPEGFGGKLCENRTSDPVNEIKPSGTYFTRLTGNTTLSVGSSVILECAVNDPTARVKWLFHGRILTKADASRGAEVHPGGVLVIPEVKDELSGRYTCMAWTSNDLIEQSLWLSLKEPCSLHVAKAPRNVTAREGQTAMFECHIPDADVLFWRKDGDIIESGTRKRILINKYLVVKDIIETDAGEYTCAARAKSGCFSKVSAHLTVDVPGHRAQCGKAFDDPYMYEERLREGRISWGSESKPGSAPWHVMIREVSRKTTFCGGSLISADTVMTAAHCIGQFEDIFHSPFDPSHIVLYFGTSSCDGENGESRRISSYLVHERFNDTFYNNDIAIFKLDRPVEFTKMIMPICLESPTFLEDLLKPGRKGLITGCGSRSFNTEVAVKYLNEVQVPYVARQVCEDRANVVNTTFTSGMMCAGYAIALRGDACAGDSGGPWVIHFHGRAIQAGIVSWGVGCDRAKHYGYYTNIAHYYQWILDKL